MLNLRRNKLTKKMYYADNVQLDEQTTKMLRPRFASIKNTQYLCLYG